MLARRPGSAIKPVGSPVAPLRALVAQAATRQRLHKLGQISGVARIPRRTRTPERTLPPLLPRLPALLVFSPHSSRCQLEAHCLTTVPSAQISRLRGNLPRCYHRPRSPQLRLRPRRNCSDLPLAAESTRKNVRTQRRFPRWELVPRFCEATINTCRWMKELRRLQRAKREGDLPKNADPAELARYVMTVLQGMTVQGADARVPINYVESRKWHCARCRSVSLNVTVPTPKGEPGLVVALDNKRDPPKVSERR